MVLHPEQFLEMAVRLSKDPRYRNEPGWRTLIGRAYYACFLASRKRMQELGSSFTDIDRLHRDVIEAVKEVNRGMANHLDTLRDRRVHADYFLNDTFRADECSTWLRLADTIMNEVSMLKK